MDMYRGDDTVDQTRLIAIGAAPLVEGFGLIGFETYPDATFKDLQLILEDLVRRKTPALLLLETELARCPCGVMDRIRTEQAHIVIVEIPQLHAPQDFNPEVERLIRTVLGPSALEPNS